MTKLTTHQIAMLKLLVEGNGDVTIPHAIYRQDLRTARSLSRKFNITVARVTKLPGARFSYGYRAIHVTCAPVTVSNIQALLRIKYDTVVETPVDQFVRERREAGVCEECGLDHDPRVVSCQDRATRADRIAAAQGRRVIELRLPVSSSNPIASQTCKSCGLRFGRHYLSCTHERGEVDLSIDPVTGVTRI